MTIKQYESLLEFEKWIGTAVYGNYVRAIPSNSLQKLDEIYKSMYDGDSRLTSGCGHCALRALQRIGKDFYAYRERHQEKITVQDEPEPKTVNKRKSTTKNNKK